LLVKVLVRAYAPAGWRRSEIVDFAELRENSASAAR